MSDIKVTIMGTTAGVPTKNRAHAAIYLSYDHADRFSCLFDCGEGTQRQLLKSGNGISDIDHVFITHWHGDHCLGLPGLLDTMGFDGRQRPMFVYGPRIRMLKRCIGIIHPGKKFKIISKNIRSKGSGIRDVLLRDPFRIVSIPVKHNVPAVAYAFIEKDRISVDTEKLKKMGLPLEDRFYKRLKEKGEVRLGSGRLQLNEVSTIKRGRKVVYSGDTEICDNLKMIARGADLLIQDCTYMDHPGSSRPHSHASLPEIIEMVSEIRVKRVVLTHISRKYQAGKGLGIKIEEYPFLELAEDLYEVTV